MEKDEVGVLKPCLPEEFTIEVFRAPGQGVNENSRGVRVTHNPSGTKVVHTDGLLYENKMACFKSLEALGYPLVTNKP